MTEHQHQYLLVLLARASPSRKAECIDASIGMLNTLDSMVSDSEEPFNGIIWQLVCCPFTPFLSLFGDVISNGHGESESNLALLHAMEKLPVFLTKMSVRNSLAGNLKRIAVVFVQQARDTMRSEGVSLLETIRKL